jgi:asparagine synthase (glutamine-hydrolysing)
MEIGLMCGIAGIVDRRGCPAESTALASNAVAMTGVLAHRGPDGEDVWLDPDAGVAFGHRRLAIVDLSPAGRQPMLSSNRRFVITYNGEVYNAPELRAELETRGLVLRGRSDTEVVVEGCALWGLDGCVDRLNGMFAFALWDRHRRELALVRDRLGIKPLYWAQLGKLFLFGSELKALRAHPGFAGEIDRDALAGFMRHGYIAAPRSVYRDVHKLEPGHILTLTQAGRLAARCYWSIREIACRPPPPRPAALAEELGPLLSDAVGRCMISDVPLGAFLSGGIDSSTVVALMQKRSYRPVRTFTIGFDDGPFNEAVHAKAVARSLGTDHTELYVQDRDLLEVVPRLSYYFDEPFADPSQIPTYLLAALTRRQVTVALSGDGGDELFAGYARYFQAQRLWRVLVRMPGSVRRLLADLLDRASDAGAGPNASGLLAALSSPMASDKLHKLTELLRGGDSLTLYRQLQSDWPRPEALVLGGKEPRGPHWEGDIRRRLPNLIDQLRLIDFLTYLPDHVLTKVDRATMAAGLEARVPLLDHRVVAFAWSLPSAVHIRNGKGKWLLRQILTRHVPAALIERPKWGFMPPLARWLRGPLRPWADALLDPRALRDQGILQPELVRARWRYHLSAAGREVEWCSALWNVLTLQAWLDRQKSGVPGTGRLGRGEPLAAPGPGGSVTVASG